MRKVFTWMDNGTYKAEKKEYKGNAVYFNVKQLGDLIREGHNLLITCDNLGIDYTKETLIKIAFQGALKDNIRYDSEFSLVDMLAEIIDEDLLYEIIESGNMEEYILKKRRGVIR